jgi:hypothetical protein
LQPYVIKQGDHLALLAYKFGFDANKVWNDPKNADLRKLRPDPNILWPTDILYIPDQNVPPVMHTLTTGATNTFVADPPTVTVSLRFLDDDLASQAFTVQELPNLAGLTTDAEGRATFPAPVTLATATLAFETAGRIVSAQLGGLDPIDTLSGVFQRLKHLGYIGLDEVFDATNLEVLRTALRALKAAQAGPPDSSPSSARPDSSPNPSALGPGSDPSPLTADSEGAPPSSAPASGPPASSSSRPPPPSDSSPGSTPAPPSSGGSVAPPSSPPSSPNADSTPPSNGGLNDDGTLDDETRALLLKVHES